MSENLKYVILTGASGKIGKVLCRELLNGGYGVMALVNRDESVGLLSGEFAQAFAEGKLHVQKCNLRDEGQRKELLRELTKKNLNIYGLINNARSLDTLASETNGFVNQENFMNEYLLGVYVAYDLSFHLAQTSSLKRIVNISSIYGMVSTTPNLYESEKQRPPVQYGVAKSALIHLSRELSTRFCSQEITVNTVSYGGVEGRVNEDFLNKYKMLCPQKRMLNEGDLSGGVLFLLSSGAGSVNGHNLVVDGGWTSW